MDKVDMLERLISYFSGGNKSQFASLLGVKPQTISSWEGRNTFDAELIYSKCGIISGDWLLSGQGEMLKSSRDSNVALANPENKLLELCKMLVAVYDQKDYVMGELASTIKALEQSSNHE